MLGDFLSLVPKSALKIALPTVTLLPQKLILENKSPAAFPTEIPG